MHQMYVFVFQSTPALPCPDTASERALPQQPLKVWLGDLMWGLMWRLTVVLEVQPNTAFTSNIQGAAL